MPQQSVGGMKVGSRVAEEVMKMMGPIDGSGKACGRSGQAGRLRKGKG
jgi:hypothetical protein